MKRLIIFVALIALLVLALPAFAQDTPPETVPTDPPPIVALDLEEIIVIVVVIILVIVVVVQRKDIGYLKEWRLENRARMEQIERGYATAPEASRRLVDTLATVSDALDEFVPQLEGITDFLRDIQTPGAPVEPLAPQTAVNVNLTAPRPDANTD